MKLEKYLKTVPESEMLYIGFKYAQGGFAFIKRKQDCDWEDMDAKAEKWLYSVRRNAKRKLITCKERVKSYESMKPHAEALNSCPYLPLRMKTDLMSLLHQMDGAGSEVKATEERIEKLEKYKYKKLLNRNVEETYPQKFDDPKGTVVILEGIEGISGYWFEHEQYDGIDRGNENDN